MSFYEGKTFKDIVAGNSYVGRGIVIGQSEDASKAVIAYFIMGRSDNSRNRVFVRNGENLMIKPFDESKVEDPSLIIYYPVRKLNNTVIVTNGNQTDTIFNYLQDGETFEDALDSREFEPDAPNFTPRISGMVSLDSGKFSYKMSILKSGDAEGSFCNRFYYNYCCKAGIGHFIHTYEHDGNPIPTFVGEPRRVRIPNSIDDFAKEIWTSLDEDNKISLYVEYIDLKTGEVTSKLVNKNK